MRYYLLIAILICCGGAYAQSAKVTLHGTLVMSTGEEFPYRIELTEANNIITGYAYTFDERDEAQSVIKGKVDKQNRKLTFKETEIVKSTNVVTKAFMCMVQASLEYRNSQLSGTANSKQLDNTACTPGTITFSNVREIEELFSSHDKYDVEIRMGEKKKEETPVAVLEAIPVAANQANVTDKITVGVEKSFMWYSDSVVLDVWDGSTFDGDIVSILFDGKPVLNKYVIQKGKKRISFFLPLTGIHTLAIVAENEGTDPPNTATLTLYDGTAHYNIISYNKKGSQSVIKIKKEK